MNCLPAENVDKNPTWEHSTNTPRNRAISYTNNSHFGSDLQNYHCLQVNGLRELGSLELIQMQGKAILLLILFDSLQMLSLNIFKRAAQGSLGSLGFKIV